MKYVLDASVALKWVLPEVDSDKAVILQNQFTNNVCELIAPDTFLVEVAHALTRAERKGVIHPPEGFQKFLWISNCSPILTSYLPLLP
jgi:predicted nucleic acid-binding protein